MLSPYVYVGEGLKPSPTLPACLCHAGDIPARRHFPETQAAYLKFPEIRPGPAAQLAPVVFPNLELWRHFLFRYQAFLSHSILLLSLFIAELR